MYKDDLSAALNRAEAAEKELKKLNEKKAKKRNIQQAFYKLFSRSSLIIGCKVIAIMLAISFAGGLIYYCNSIGRQAKTCVEDTIFKCKKACHKEYPLTIGTNIHFLAKYTLVECTCYLKKGINYLTIVLKSPCRGNTIMKDYYY